MITRRDFLGTMATGATGLAIAASARSYAQIIGANDRVQFAVCGLNSRGYAHLSSLSHHTSSSRLAYVCDVDTAILEKYAEAAQKTLGYAPTAEQDFRKMLAAKDVDAITIATPDHWHAPMAILALQAGKHVYVEKPCSYNPTEGEMLIAAQKKTGKLMQMGSQQRSSPHTIDIIAKIHGGLIGEATHATTWYVNNRKATFYGPESSPPAALAWDIWQGPAPRRPYRANIHPYNWHWLKLYGTGESLNNGSHEVDVARWALDVTYPTAITASGGNYQFKDDWQFYDTLNTSFEYPGKMITWQGWSRQPLRLYDRDRGVLVRGTKGSVIVDRDGYEVWDPDNKKIDDFKVSQNKTLSSDIIGADSMTDAHFANFIAAIQHGEKLRQPIESGNVCVTMLQLSNIAWDVNRKLQLDPMNGHILDDPRALALTHREYEKGWEPTV